jgi:hypothetical protein
MPDRRYRRMPKSKSKFLCRQLAHEESIARARRRCSLFTHGDREEIGLALVESR